jgi:transcription elongation factor GreA
VERPRVIEAIAEARAHGDLSENAEYDAAKDQQAFIEGRIAELEAKLALAEIINPSRLNVAGKVVFGAHVELYDQEGELEADLDSGQISLTSPIGRALIGKGEGEEGEVATPGGLRQYEILRIRYE